MPQKRVKGGGNRVFHVPLLSIDGGVIFLSKLVCLISFNNVSVVPLAYSC